MTAPTPTAVPDAGAVASDTAKQDERQKKITESYAVASKTLRERHTEEFNALRKEHLKALGIDWSPAPTAAEKAEAEVRKLVSDHPELAQKFGIKL